MKPLDELSLPELIELLHAVADELMLRAMQEAGKIEGGRLKREVFDHRAAV